MSATVSLQGPAQQVSPITFAPFGFAFLYFASGCLTMFLSTGFFLEDSPLDLLQTTIWFFGQLMTTGIMAYQFLRLCGQKP